MVREYARSDLASPMHAFFAIGDHQNLRSEVAPDPVVEGDLRYALNHHLLFSERIFFIAEDMLVNERLMSLLVNDYRPLLTDGLFVPLLRDEHDSLADCEKYLTAADYYNQTGDAVWRQYLRTLKKTRLSVGRFDANEAYAHFSEVARGYFRDAELLRRLNIPVPPPELDRAVSGVLRETGRDLWRRSALFRVADDVAKRAGADTGRSIRMLASVIYTSHYAGLFKQVGIYPEWYQRYIGLLLALPLSSSDQPAGVQAQLTAVMPNTRQQDIAGLPLAEIYRLRETREFTAYLDAVRGSSDHPERHQATVVNALTRYLSVMDERVAERQSGAAGGIRAARRNLAMIRVVSAVGAVLGLAEVAVDPAALTEAALAGAGVVMVVLDRLAARHLTELEQRRRTFWLDYCGNSGTFEAQVQRLRALPPTKENG
ncbi:hypothetical protein SUDANB95_04165 [Actinosynnema sp. ALI-1.44]